MLSLRVCFANSSGIYYEAFHIYIVHTKKDTDAAQEYSNMIFNICLFALA